MKCSSVLRRRALILAGTMLMGAGFVAQAHAEDAPLDEGDAGLGSIVVTAQKTETNLQKTPIAISVLGSDDLKARSVVSLKDLGDGAVPSLRIAP
ncbi:MAG: TonB-dependent receptor, partial [Sphingobium yanoikuyae]